MASDAGHVSESAADAGRGIAPPGFRLPDTTRLGVVRLQVSDIERSLAYYDRVLGLRPLRASRGAAVLGVGDAGTPLLKLRNRPGAHPVPRRGRLGPFHFAILLPDRASLGRLISHLSAIGERAGMSDHLVSEAIYLSDPDGLGIEVYADRPRAKWRYDGREIAISTPPLDVQDLVAAGDGRRWSGMPNGTTSGRTALTARGTDRARHERQRRAVPLLPSVSCAVRRALRRYVSIPLQPRETCSSRRESRLAGLPTPRVAWGPDTQPPP